MHCVYNVHSLVSSSLLLWLARMLARMNCFNLVGHSRWRTWCRQKEGGLLTAASCGVYVRLEYVCVYTVFECPQLLSQARKVWAADPDHLSDRVRLDCECPNLCSDDLAGYMKHLDTLNYLFAFHPSHSRINHGCINSDIHVSSRQDLFRTGKARE